MKKIALLAVFASALAFGQTKKLVSSDIHWWGYKLVKTEASSHDGTLNLKSGNLVMKGNTIVGGTFVFDMKSINSTDLSGEKQAKLDSHLKDGDFFEVEKFPTAEYKITSVKKGGTKNFPFIVSGNLTVKGKTNMVSFPANIKNDKGTISIISDKFTWDRQKFNVSYKSTMEDVAIKDDIDMTIKVTLK